MGSVTITKGRMAKQKAGLHRASTSVEYMIVMMLVGETVQVQLTSLGETNTRKEREDICLAKQNSSPMSEELKAG